MLMISINTDMQEVELPFMKLYTPASPLITKLTPSRSTLEIKWEICVFGEFNFSPVQLNVYVTLTKPGFHAFADLNQSSHNL